MESFRRERMAEFAVRLVRHIATEFPVQFRLLKEEGARALVDRAIEDGNKNGIAEEGAIAVLVELRVEFGERFERAPARDKALKIFTHPELPGIVKVQVIREIIETETEGRRLVPYIPSPL